MRNRNNDDILQSIEVLEKGLTELLNLKQTLSDVGNVSEHIINDINKEI